jgi:hypothetical protein
LYVAIRPESGPAGCLKKLALSEPELTFDPANLETEQEWIAGREVFRYRYGDAGLKVVSTSFIPR